MKILKSLTDKQLLFGHKLTIVPEQNIKFHLVWV